MRGPLDNKARDPADEPGRQAHTHGVVERFPRRDGVRLVSDRELTPAEARLRQEEMEMESKARAYRQRGLRNRTEKTEPIIVEGLADGPRG